MCRGTHSHGCAYSDAAAYCHFHDGTRSDLGTHCDPYGCICTVPGAHRYVLARADGNPETHGHSHVRGYANAGTNPDRCGARG